LYVGGAAESKDREPKRVDSRPLKVEACKPRRAWRAVPLRVMQLWLVTVVMTVFWWGRVRWSSRGPLWLVVRKKVKHRLRKPDRR
jgi:hypothetical protein